MMTKQEIFNNPEVFRKNVLSIVRSFIPPNDLAYVLHEVKKLPQGATIVEIGTCVGGTTRHLAKARPDCTIYTVDINKWRPDDGLLAHCKECWGLSEIDDEIMMWAQKIYTEDCPNVHLVTSRSLDFQIDKIDFLFLDGDHSFNNVLSELRYYWDKMNPEGVIMGDDIIFDDPYDAVKIFGYEENLEILIYGKTFKIFKQSKDYLESFYNMSKDQVHKFGPKSRRP